MYKKDATKPKEEVVTVETEGTDESLKIDEEVETVKPEIEKRIIPMNKHLKAGFKKKLGELTITGQKTPLSESFRCYCQTLKRSL